MLAAGEPVVEEAPRRDVAGEDALDESGVLASEEVSRPVGRDVCEARICVRRPDRGIDMSMLNDDGEINAARDEML